MARFLEPCVWFRCCRSTVARHDTMFGQVFVGDRVSSTKGCIDTSRCCTFGLSVIGFCQSRVARQGTTLRTFCLWDWVLSISGCKARHDGSNILSVGLGSVDQWNKARHEASIILSGCMGAA